MKTSFTIEVNMNPEEQFKTISDQLFNHYILQTPVSKYRFAEIEFYFCNQCPDERSHDYHPFSNSMYGPPLEYASWKGVTSWEISHQDYFTHCFGNQGKSDFWYLHMNRNGKLKSGKRKGIDLTLGNEDELTFGGILIRAIQANIFMGQVK
jgi:hypothetical protein